MAAESRAELYSCTRKRRTCRRKRRCAGMPEPDGWNDIMFIAICISPAWKNAQVNIR